MIINFVGDGHFTTPDGRHFKVSAIGETMIFHATETGEIADGREVVGFIGENIPAALYEFEHLYAAGLVYDPEPIPAAEPGALASEDAVAALRDALRG